MTNVGGVLQFLLSCQRDFTLASMLMKPFKLRKGCHKLRRNPIGYWQLLLTVDRGEWKMR